MARTFKDYALVSLKGIAMGAADVIPGVSGGTIAFITGIYEELISSIGAINFSLIKTLKPQSLQSFWSKLNGNFLLALIIGIGISIFSLMRVAHYLIEEHPIHIWSFFFGLVLASVWFIAKQINSFKLSYAVIFSIGALIAYGITQITPAQGEVNEFYLFFCGALAICAMILPGISGAFILLLLGAYETISQAVSDFNFKTLLIVGLGAITGLLSFSKLLKWLFTYYKNFTLALLSGFILGSLNKIWPWKQVLETKQIKDKIVVISEQSVWPDQFDGENYLFASIGLMLLGFVSIIILEKIGEKKS